MATYSQKDSTSASKWELRKDSHSGAGKTIQDIADFTAADRVDAIGGFVEDEQAGFMDEGLGKAKALEHAFGIFSDAHVAPAVQANEVEVFGNALFAFGRLETGERRIKIEHSVAGEVSGEAVVFREIANRPACFRKGGVAAEQGGGTAGGTHGGEDHLNERRLPCPVCTQQAELGADRNAQGEIGDSFGFAAAETRAVDFFQPLGFQSVLGDHVLLEYE